MFVADKEELEVVFESYLPWLNFTLLKTEETLYKSNDVKNNYIQLFRALADKLPQASLPNKVNLCDYFFETSFNYSLMPTELYSELQDHVRSLFLDSQIQEHELWKKPSSLQSKYRTSSYAAFVFTFDQAKLVVPNK